MPPPVFRFAPSPNGFLHLGHAYSALLNFDLARENGGRMLLRIEDIDPTRCRPEYENAIFEDLAWLGIAWEQPVRRQSEHLDVYREAVERLEREGLVYPAFESRSQIVKLVIAKDKEGAWPRDPDNALALFYLGMAEAEAGNKTEAAAHWKKLLEKLPADAPIRDLIQKRLAALETEEKK